MSGSAQFGDNLYGTSKATIEEQMAKGKTVILDIEIEGVKQIKASGFPARFVFIAPPSEEELERRLRGRGTEKEEAIQKRLRQAKVELEYSKVPGMHDKIIVNDVSPFPPSGRLLRIVLTTAGCRIWKRRIRNLRISFLQSH
jgi:Guanylate kinase